MQGVVSDERRRAVVAAVHLEGPQRRHPPSREPPGQTGGQDDERERHPEHGQREKRRDRQNDQDAVGQGAPTDPVDGLDHDGDDGGSRSGEQARDDSGRPRRQVEDGQPEQRKHAGQDEEDPGDEPTEGAVEQPPRVDRELLGLRAGQQHAVVQGVQEPALPDPTLLVDQLVLHDRDLSRRATERLHRDREPRPRRLPERDDVAGTVPPSPGCAQDTRTASSHERTLHQSDLM